METIETCIAEIKKTDIHVREVEKLLKLLLVNSLIDDASRVDVVEEHELDERVKKTLKQHKVTIEKEDVIGGLNVYYLKAPKNMILRECMTIYEVFREYEPKSEPIFQFKKLDGMLKKRMMEEKISYYIMGKELHIYSFDGKKR